MRISEEIYYQKRSFLDFFRNKREFPKKFLKIKCSFRYILWNKLNFSRTVLSNNFRIRIFHEANFFSSKWFNQELSKHYNKITQTDQNFQHFYIEFLYADSKIVLYIFLYIVTIEYRNEKTEFVIKMDITNLVFSFWYSIVTIFIKKNI